MGYQITLSFLIVASNLLLANCIFLLTPPVESQNESVSPRSIYLSSARPSFVPQSADALSDQLILSPKSMQKVALTRQSQPDPSAFIQSLLGYPSSAFSSGRQEAMPTNDNDSNEEYDDNDANDSSDAKTNLTAKSVLPKILASLLGGLKSKAQETAANPNQTSKLLDILRQRSDNSSISNAMKLLMNQDKQESDSEAPSSENSPTITITSQVNTKTIIDLNKKKIDEEKNETSKMELVKQRSEKQPINLSVFANVLFKKEIREVKEVKANPSPPKTVFLIPEESFTDNLNDSNTDKTDDDDTDLKDDQAKIFNQIIEEVKDDTIAATEANGQSESSDPEPLNEIKENGDSKLDDASEGKSETNDKTVADTENRKEVQKDENIDSKAETAAESIGSKVEESGSLNNASIETLKTVETTEASAEQNPVVKEPEPELSTDSKPQDEKQGDQETKEE